MADGFLGRWSQRKQAAREGKALAEPLEVAVAASVPAAPVQPLTAAEAPQAQEPAPPPLSLQDVQLLTPQSDFSPFVAREVAPEVRNAAMKKLFTDPHYNVMDGLDIYIDDYAKPDPLPEAMLRQMVSAKFLKLFDDEGDEATPGPADPPDSRGRDDADTAAPGSVAQSAAPPSQSAAPLTDNPAPAPGIADDHTDLRLQPNHAAGAASTGRGTQ